MLTWSISLQAGFSFSDSSSQILSSDKIHLNSCLLTLNNPLSHWTWIAIEILPLFIFWTCCSWCKSSTLAKWGMRTCDYYWRAVVDGWTVTQLTMIFRGLLLKISSFKSNLKDSPTDAGLYMAFWHYFPFARLLTSICFSMQPDSAGFNMQIYFYASV